MPIYLKGFSAVKIVIFWTLLLTLGIGGYFGYKYYLNRPATITSPLQNEQVTDAALDGPEYEGITSREDIALDTKSAEKAALTKSAAAKDPSDKSSPFNLLVLGIDRRYASQTSWRTDVIQLITFSPNRKNAVVTHIPRDVWAGSYKINAVYNLQGPDAMKDIVEEITGQRPDRIIRLDFDAFVWAVDAVGGVNVDVPVEFEDNFYPDDRSGSDDVMTVKFDKGEQTMDGEEALIYARSRKGTNGEGSDYARGLRQQLIMKAVVADYFKPNNLFKPKTAKVLYDTATQKVYTDLSLKDTETLYDLINNYKDIHEENLSLNTENFLVSPADRTPYGGAWTLISKDGDYSKIHDEINRLLTL